MAILVLKSFLVPLQLAFLLYIMHLMDRIKIVIVRALVLTFVPVLMCMGVLLLKLVHLLMYVVLPLQLVFLLCIMYLMDRIKIIIVWALVLSLRPRMLRLFRSAFSCPRALMVVLPKFFVFQRPRLKFLEFLATFFRCIVPWAL